MAAVVAFAGLGVYYLVSGVAGKGDSQQYLSRFSCRSDDCVKSESLLIQSLNTNVDPCHDFKAYATSRWLPDSHQDVSELWNYKWHVKYNWMSRVASEIASRDFESHLGNMVASSFSACVNRSAERANDTRTMFKELMRSLGIPWPEAPPRDANPFDVYMNLCVRWNIPLWFDIRLLPDNTLKGQRTVYIGPSAFAKFWAKQFRSISGDSAVRGYINQYLVYFAGYDEAARDEQLAANCYTVFMFTRQVVFMLETIHENVGSKAYTFDSLSNAFGQRADRFASLMNRYFRLEKAFVGADMAIVEKVGTAEVTRYIVDDHDPPLVLSHLGWWVLQIYAPIVDNSFFVLKYGNKELGDLMRPLFCETQMEHSFKILLLSKHVALNFPPKVRQRVDDILVNVREMVAATYEHSNWPPMTRARVGEKIRAMRINLWPMAEYLSSETLTRIYRSHHTTKNTALDHWIAERRANAALLGSGAYFEDKRLPHSFARDAVYYDFLLNEAFVSMMLVHEPLYYPDADSAINYGGVGAAFASAVMHGVGSGQDALSLVPSSHATTAEKERPLSGNATFNQTRESSSRSLVDTVPGFLPAFHALQAHKAEWPTQLREFPPEKLFFINYCHTQSRMNIAFDCNGAVRGDESFGFAFRCAKGLPMNP
ncbi:neprilysin-1-like [Dermacentor silvarum]|uniref:neprilysin-1-like n=1 Tax=Dermacentor silvarum TaxID=543639 RepID=UPI00189BD29F|nr:neprilysin-1-like [Dermacentor silvarum]